MVITAHRVDSEFKLQKFFSQITDHKEVAIGKVIEKRLNK